MKLSLVLLLNAVTTSLTLVVTPALQLQDEIPDSEFKIQMLLDSPLLPVDAVLVVIIQFMNLAARSDFEQVAEPCKFHSTKYPTVTISTHSSTEIRFLLWGIYLAAIDMVRYVRFNAMVVNLLWKKKLVGQISLQVNTGGSLPGTSPNDTSDFSVNGGSLTLETISNSTGELSVERLKILASEDGSRTAATISYASADSLADTWNIVCGNPSTLPTGHSSNASLMSTITVDFQSVAGATRLKRNDVFLSFYAAMLYVAKFPIDDPLVRFNSKAPGVNLRVHMFDIGIGCSVTLPTILAPTVNVKQMRELTTTVSR